MLCNSLSDRMKQAVDAGIVELSQLEATSKNYFLVIWAGDFSPEKVLKTPEYFVYCGVFKRHLWTERFVQSPKGEFLEVPYTVIARRDVKHPDVAISNTGCKPKEIATPHGPQAACRAQPPKGRLLARRCGGLVRNDTDLWYCSANRQIPTCRWVGS